MENNSQHGALTSTPLLEYIHSFLAYARWQSASVAALILAGAFLEGAGILLLVPFIGLLTQANTSGEQGAGNSIVQAAVEAFSALGLVETKHQIVAVLAMFVLLAILRGVILWRRDILTASLTLGFVDHTRVTLFRALASAPWSAVSNLQHAKVQHVVTNDIGRIAVGSNLMIRGVVSLLFFSINLILALTLSPQLTILVLAFLAVSFLLLRPLQKRAQKVGQDTSRLGEVVFDVLSSFMSGLKLAKVSNAERRFVGEFERNVDNLRHRQIEFRRDQVAARLLFQTSGYLLASFVVALGLFVTATPLPILVALIVIFSRLTGPFLAIQQSAQSIAKMLPAFSNFQDLMKSIGQVPAEQSAQHCIQGEAYSQNLPAEIKCSNLTFGRNASAENGPILDGVDLTIAPGEMLALAGASGAGKTTLADILVGLLTPTRGQIRIGCEAVTKARLGAWRESISYVPQDPFLFDRTIKENLTWAAPAATDQEIWSALALVGAVDFVQQLPQGLDTRVGERGQRFSGGERQRICLARALLRNPVLLVLDEATNALDLESERQFLAALSARKRQMSVLVISHRLNSLEVVDRIAVMTDGRITETGNYAALSRDPNSHFSELLTGRRPAEVVSA